FFFKAEDGIRARDLTGVQTSPLPIWFPTLVPTPGRHGQRACREYPGSRPAPLVGAGAPPGNLTEPRSPRVIQLVHPQTPTTAPARPPRGGREAPRGSGSCAPRR